MEKKMRTLEEVNAWLATQPPQDHPWALFWGVLFLILALTIWGYLIVDVWKICVSKWFRKHWTNMQ